MSTEHDGDPHRSTQTPTTGSGEAEGTRARSGTSPRPRREVSVSSIAQRRLEAGSLFPGPPPQLGRATAVVADLAAVAAGAASATVAAFLFSRAWSQSAVIGTLVGVVTLIQRVLARRRRLAG